MIKTGLIGAAVLVASACGSADSSSVIVLAASSTSDVLDEISQAAETTNPSLDLELVIAGSPSLIAQLESGVDADVLITADEATMDRAVASGRVNEAPVVIATNSLVVALAPGNPGDVTDLVDLTDPTLLIGACAVDVPCGALAIAAMDAAGLSLEPDTEELSVRALASKIQLGEIDAGLIYRTDAAALELETVNTPSTQRLDEHTNRYFLALIGESPTSQARSLVDLILTATGRRILSDDGFGLP